MMSGYRTGYPNPAEQEIDRLRRENQALNQRVNEFTAHVDRLRKLPAPHALVLRVDGDRVMLSRGPDTYETLRPEFEVKPTQVVRVHPETNSIMSIVDRPDVAGRILKVLSLIGDSQAEVEIPGAGTGIVIFHGKPPAPGDRVVVDPGIRLALQNLGPTGAGKAPVETGVEWDDIGGQEEAKRLLRQAIEGPVIDKDLRARYGRKRTKGALLAGPPGTGKTMLGRACATALAKLYGGATTATGFQYVKGPELLNYLLGNSEGNVRALFQNARAHAKEHGYPGVIMLDEADAILSRRDAARFANVEKTIVPMFLTEMDGLEDSGAFVLVATNRPDMLDPAITREGRLDLKIQVGRPSREDAAAILARYFRSRPLDGMTVEQACEKGVEHVFAPRHTLYMIRMKAGADRRFTLGDIVSGALLAGLVERATDHAIDRDRAEGKVTGIRTGDIRAAADALMAEQRVLEHRAELDEFTADYGADVRMIERAK